jgi:hypothetical protein
MSNWFYYNEKGEKIAVTGGQLKGLAKMGIITPGTMVETEEGKAAPARKVKGLTFAVAAQPTIQPVVPPPAELNPFTAVPAAMENPFVATPSSFAQPAQVASAAVPSGESGSASVSHYFIWSIISTLCVFPPLGIVALIFSYKCKKWLVVGSYDSAAKNSKIALYCNITAIVCMLIVLGNTVDKSNHKGAPKDSTTSVAALDAKKITPQEVKRMREKLDFLDWGGMYPSEEAKDSIALYFLLEERATKDKLEEIHFRYFFSATWNNEKRLRVAYGCLYCLSYQLRYVCERCP